MVKIEVVYGDAQHQTLLDLVVQEGCTIRQALEQALPTMDTSTLEVGIFGKKVGLEHFLQANDRIEVYRPLAMDPMEARRLKAQADSRLKKAKKQKVI
jgi:putative ubiquitin-RnfH superfamily antitoxin RatB of RatAB toxin-antitoxin module